MSVNLQFTPETHNGTLFPVLGDLVGGVTKHQTGNWKPKTPPHRNFFENSLTYIGLWPERCKHLSLIPDLKRRASSMLVLTIHILSLGGAILKDSHML